MNPSFFTVLSASVFYAPSWVNQLGTQYVGLGAFLLYPAHKYTVLEPPAGARDGEGLSDVV